ncbi:hypothetical protein D3C87_1577190 [compost metagenome]
MVDDIQVIERVIVTNHLAQVRADSPDHAIALFFPNKTAGIQLAEIMATVETVGAAVAALVLDDAGPGVVTHAIDLLGPRPTPGGGHALWVPTVEQCHAIKGQRLVRGLHIDGQQWPALPGLNQPHHHRQQAQAERQQPASGGIGRVVARMIVSQFRTTVGPGHRGHRCDPLGALGRRIAG